MLRISLPYVIQLSDELEKLSNLPDQDVPRWPTLMSILGASWAEPVNDFETVTIAIY